MLKNLHVRYFNILLILIILIVINSSSPGFLGIDNLMIIAKNSAVLGILSLGMLVVIILGGLDMSVAAVLAATSLCLGYFLTNISSNIILALLFACIVGILFGIFNGFIIAYLKIGSIIATLATMSIIKGMLFIISNGSWINDIPKNIINFSQIKLLGFIPIHILFWVFISLLTYILLKHTQIGRGIYAIGDNKKSATYIGFNIKKITVFTYGYMGFTIGIASFVHILIAKNIDPNAFSNLQFIVILIVLLGGATFYGGYGNVLDTFLGVTLYSIINNGLIILHVSSFLQPVVLGIVILLVCAFDTSHKKMRLQQLTE